MRKTSVRPVEPQTLDESVAEILKDETAQSRAVNSLISVKETKGFGSDIELKTDLDESQVCIHTALDIMDYFLMIDKERFSNASILKLLTTLKERKSLSKDRKSRMEIVEVARSPDMTMMNGMPQQNQSFVKGFFKSKRPPTQ